MNSCSKITLHPIFKWATSTPLVALLMSSLLWTNGSIAQAPMGKNQFDRTIWTGNAVYTVNSKRDYGMIAVMKLGNSLMKNASDVDRSAIQEKLNSVFENYQRRIDNSRGNYRLNSDPIDAIQKVIGIAGEVFGKDAKVKTGAVVMQEMLGWGVRFYEHDRRPKEQVSAQEGLASQTMELQAEAARIFEKSWDLAHEDPRNAKIIDGLMASELGSSVLQDGKTILQNNRGFLDSKIVEAMAVGIDPDGSIRLKEDDFAKIAQQKLDDLQQTLVDTRNESARSQRIRDEINDRVNVERLAEQKFELTTQAGRSSIYILSTFIGFSNPERGHQLSVVGNATLQVVESLHQFNRGFDGVSMVGNAISSTILTGNILNAATDIASLFKGPSADAMVLQEVERLRKQILELSKQMNDRFDRVDFALNEIYASLNDNFLAIEAKFRETRIDVSAVQKNLLQLQEQVKSLELNLYDTVAAGFNRQFTGYEETCFEDQNRYQFEQISQELLTRCLSQFRIYGSEFSSDPLSSRRANPVLSKNLWNWQGIPPHLLRDELQYGLESNLDLLSNLASAPALKLGNGGLAALGTIPNPIEWARGAHAYIKLLTSKWDRLSRIYPFEATQKLIEKGKVIEEFSAAIGTETGFNGTRANEAFFYKLLNSYRERSKTLSQIIVEKMNARYGKRSSGHFSMNFPMTDDPERSDGGFAPVGYKRSDPGLDANPESSGIDMTGMKIFPEFYSSVPNIYKFAHQMGFGELIFSVNPFIFEIGNRPASDSHETCEEANKCRAGFNVSIAYRTADRNTAAIVSMKSYSFKDKPPYFVGRMSARGGTKLDHGEYVKRRVNEYSSFDDFMKDVDVMDELPSIPEGSPLRAGQKLIKPQDLLVQVKLAQSQAQQLYADDLRSYATDDDILTAAMDLGVAKQLLESYLRLGLPQTFGSSDRLRGFFGGNQSLVDDKILLDAFQKSRPGRISELALRFDEESTKRVDSFEKELKEALKEVHESEALPIVKNTMKELELVLNAQKAARPSTYSVEEAYQQANAELDLLLQ